MRKISKVFHSVPAREGAGVHLKRAFGYHQSPLFDPSLMLDDFHTSKPEEYLAGFPWHPHRGIETITYLLEGVVEHGDNMGNREVFGAGDVQWMTAGSGIIHQEMLQLLFAFYLDATNRRPTAAVFRSSPCPCKRISYRPPKLIQNFISQEEDFRHYHAGQRSCAQVATPA